MAQEKRENPLKGPNGVWLGMSDQSFFAPTGGGFETLRNCYISQDGTEIRRMPPLTIWADPRLCDPPIGISAMTAGNVTTVTFSQDHKLADQSGLFTLGFRVYISGNGVIPNGWYPITRGSSSTEAVIAYTTTTTSTSGDFMIERCTIPHGLQQVGDRLCVVGESLTTMVDPDLTNHPKHALATWVAEEPVDHENPLVFFEYWGNVLNRPDNQSLVAELWENDSVTSAKVRVKHGYARVGDKFYITVSGLAAGGVANGTYLATVTDPYLYCTLNTNQNGNTTEYTGTGVLSFQAFSRQPRRKSQTDVADGRLIMAIPGEGVCFQAHIALDSETTLPIERTRLLGVPKATIVSVTQSTGGTLADGNYLVAIAYKDITTGEYGLVSETYGATVAAGGGTASLILTYHTPRAVLRESYGCSVVVYITDTNGDVGTLKPTAEINSVGFLVSINETYTITATGTDTKALPVIENLPMGATCVRTIKGVTYFGGPLASLVVEPATSAENVYLTIAGQAKNEITFSPLTGDGIVDLAGSPAADYQVPSSFGGVAIQYGSYSLTHLDKKINSPVVANRGYLQHWTIKDVHDASVDYVTATAGVISYPRGIVWFSEQGHPGISPSTHRMVIDRLRGVDVTGLGRFRDSLIACTDRETYMLNWSRSPLGTDPMCVSTEHGCIAPSSMVQSDAGLAWLSERGPVLLSGAGLSWIGAPIYERWKSLQRDGKGQMPHAFSAHDPVRKLLLFFVRADRDMPLYQNQSDDDARSKVACDEVLVFSYGAGAWSFWELDRAHECVDATQIMGADGVARVGILTSTKLIMAFDEDIRAEFEPCDVELVTKSIVASTLERGTKVGGVNLRLETASPSTGYAIEAFVTDDKKRETRLSEVKPASDVRTRVAGGAALTQDYQVRLRLVGSGPLRIKDITVEVSPGG